MELSSFTNRFLNVTEIWTLGFLLVFSFLPGSLKLNEVKQKFVGYLCRLQNGLI